MDGNEGKENGKVRNSGRENIASCDRSLLSLYWYDAMRALLTCLYGSNAVAVDGDDKGYINLRRSPKHPEPSLVTRFPRAGVTSLFAWRFSQRLTY
jgi:hypothetical protein